MKWLFISQAVWEWKLIWNQIKVFFMMNVIYIPDKDFLFVKINASNRTFFLSVIDIGWKLFLMQSMTNEESYCSITFHLFSLTQTMISLSIIKVEGPNCSSQKCRCIYFLDKKFYLNCLKTWKCILNYNLGIKETSNIASDIQFSNVYKLCMANHISWKNSIEYKRQKL